MAVFSEGGVTSPDIYIGVSCIFLLLLCTALNSRVFYHNYGKQSSIARTLYLCLSATDLFASWILFGLLAATVLKDKEEACKNSQTKECNENYYWQYVPATFAMRFFTVIAFTMSFAPAHITAFLAITRFLKIKYPFFQIKTKYVILSLLTSIVWIPIVVGCAMFIDSGQTECGPAKRHIAPFSWNYCPIIVGFKVNDLISSWVLLGFFTADVIKDKEVECKDSDDPECTDEYYWRGVPATFEMRIYTVISFTLSFSPAHITAFLASTRYLKIKYPFLRIKIKYVIISLFLTVTWVPIVVGCAMFVKVDESECGPIKHSSNPFAWNYCPKIFGETANSRGYFLSMIAVPVFLQIGAMFTSILTTYELVKVYLNPVSESTGREGKRIKSSMKILLTNLGSFMHLFIIVYTAAQNEVAIDDHLPIKTARLYILFQTIIPALVSTLNPLIYIILTPDCDLRLMECVTLRSSRDGIPQDQDTATTVINAETVR
ncbi:hypothetical protein ACHWQZ_G010138 [Mnemiopsis leidyi]